MPHTVKEDLLMKWNMMETEGGDYITNDRWGDRFLVLPYYNLDDAEHDLKVMKLWHVRETNALEAPVLIHNQCTAAEQRLRRQNIPNNGTEALEHIMRLHNQTKNQIKHADLLKGPYFFGNARTSE